MNKLIDFLSSADAARFYIDLHPNGRFPHYESFLKTYMAVRLFDRTLTRLSNEYKAHCHLDRVVYALAIIHVSYEFDLRNPAEQVSCDTLRDMPRQHSRLSMVNTVYLGAQELSNIEIEALMDWRQGCTIAANPVSWMIKNAMDYLEGV